MKKRVLIIVLFLGALFSISAQKFEVTSGNLSVLKGVTNFNIQFQYDNMNVGKFTETDYIAKKVEEYNSKEPGRGDNWNKAWINDRTELFEPKFIELFNKSEKMEITDQPQKYTIIFHTTFTEPGFNIGVVRKNASINATITIVETENPSKVIAVISMTGAPGRTFSGYDFATGQRIVECYAVSGKKLPGFILKQAK